MEALRRILRFLSPELALELGSLPPGWTVAAVVVLLVQLAVVLAACVYLVLLPAGSL